ncbi:MAG: RNA methyltransferase [Candidatus Heimdallarchaeota archaeon]
MAVKIVLIEPQVEGNIGAIARVMKNFGFKDLVLINPQAEIKGDVFRFAMKAEDVIESMEIYDSLEEYLPNVSYVVGTTARITSDKGSTNARIAVSSDDSSLANILSFKDDIAILFGREDSGLTNEEINCCDMTIHIPTSEDYLALNLSQAVAIILYSLNSLKDNQEKFQYRKATKDHKEKLIFWFEKNVSVLNFKDFKKRLLVRRFRNIIGRAFVSGKEATSLVAVFSRSFTRITEYNELDKK